METLLRCDSFENVICILTGIWNGWPRNRGSIFGWRKIILVAHWLRITA